MVGISGYGKILNLDGVALHSLVLSKYIDSLRICRGYVHDIHGQKKDLSPHFWLTVSTKKV